MNRLYLANPDLQGHKHKGLNLGAGMLTEPSLHYLNKEKCILQNVCYDPFNPLSISDPPMVRSRGERGIAACKQDKSLAFTGMSFVVVEGKFLSKIGSDRLTDRTRRKEKSGCRQREEDSI